MFSVVEAEMVLVVDITVVVFMICELVVDAVEVVVVVIVLVAVKMGDCPSTLRRLKTLPSASKTTTNEMIARSEFVMGIVSSLAVYRT